MLGRLLPWQPLHLLISTIDKTCDLRDFHNMSDMEDHIIYKDIYTIGKRETRDILLLKPRTER